MPDEEWSPCTGLLLKGKLKEYLLIIQEQAEQRMELLTAQMAEAEGVTKEELKAADQMKWVGDDEQHQAFSGGNRAERAGMQPVNEEEAIENKGLAEQDSGEPLPVNSNCKGILLATLSEICRQI